MAVLRALRIFSPLNLIASDINMIKTVLRSMRIPFLILAPVSVFLGLAASVAVSEQISYFDFFLVLSGALFAHISVNTFNEYHDLAHCKNHGIR